VFDGRNDNLTHLQFQKFSKGEFKNRAMISAKKSKKDYQISTGYEFANELVKIVAQKLGTEKTRVTGAIISTNDLRNMLRFKEIKQFQGVKRYIIDDEMNGNEILEIINKFPKAFIALSFNAKDCSLMIKPKAPKSGKPDSKEKIPKADFCILKTSDSEIAKSFVFEKPDFQKAEIKHKFTIEEIKIPNYLKNTDDFEKIREESLRAGKIIRIAIIDGKEFKSEKNFEV
jgi:hypothetical protein